MAGNKVYVQGSYIDVHDNENVYLSVDKAQVEMSNVKCLTGRTESYACVAKAEQEMAREDSPECAEVPERLKAEEAKEVMEDLVNEGLLDEDWQPVGLSGSERGLIAKAVCDYLKINEVWQVFGQLWHEKPETLRGYFNKALEQKKSLEFQDRLKKILR